MWSARKGRWYNDKPYKRKHSLKTEFMLKYNLINHNGPYEQSSNSLRLYNKIGTTSQQTINKVLYYI